MPIIERIAKNSLAIIIGNVIENIFNFVIYICIIRYFGQSGFGKISFLSAFFFLLSIAYSQWLRPILIREMSRDEKNAPLIIGNGIIINSLIAVFAVILFWVSVLCSRPSGEILVLSCFMTINLLLTPILYSYEIIFMVKLRMSSLIIFNFIGKFLTLGAFCLIVLIKGGLIPYFTFSLTIVFILLPFLKFYADKIIKPSLRIDLKLWQKIIKESWPLGLSAFFIFVYHRIGNILLFNIKGDAAVGIYSVSVKFSESLSIIPTAVTCTVLPLLSRYHDISKVNFKKLYELTFKYLIIFIIPVAFYVTIFSGQIVTLFYGKNFLVSAPSLAILIWAEVFVFLGVVNNIILVASHKQKIDPLFTGVSAFVSIILNILLLPLYSFIGAAVACLIAYSVGPFMGYFLRQTREYSRCMFYYSIRPLIAASAMFFLIYYTQINFLVSIIIAPVAYFFVLLMVGGIKMEDFDFLKDNVRPEVSLELQA